MNAGIAWTMVGVQAFFSRPSHRASRTLCSSRDWPRSHEKCKKINACSAGYISRRVFDFQTVQRRSVFPFSVFLELSDRPTCLFTFVCRQPWIACDIGWHVCWNLRTKDAHKQSAQASLTSCFSTVRKNHLPQAVRYLYVSRLVLLFETITATNLS